MPSTAKTRSAEWLRGQVAHSTFDMNYGLILAAGGGSRFGGIKPKQFQKLCGRKVFAYSVSEFENSPLVDGYGIMTRREYKDEINDYLSGPGNHKCKFVIEGGKSRRQSVFIGLQRLETLKPDTVLIHDAARPAINQELLERLCKRFRRGDIVGVIPVRPLRDTIKKVDKKGFVVKTVARQQLKRVQTPQLFDFKKLISAHRNCSEDMEITDDSMLVELSAEKVAVVDGLDENQKITYPADRYLVEQFLKRKKENDS
ncbi:MAG: 2-C-methyl-D-erythritol 4-phosphate cytidylyltransferase [bacterium]